MPMRNLLFGVGVAVALATVAIGPQIAGISLWKWVLGVVGLALFVLAGRRQRP